MRLLLQLIPRDTSLRSVRLSNVLRAAPLWLAHQLTDLQESGDSLLPQRQDEPTNRSQLNYRRRQSRVLSDTQASAQYRSDEALPRTRFACHALLPYLMIFLVCRPPGPARVKTTKRDRSTLKVAE
jgi:hypothetical protein